MRIPPQMVIFILNFDETYDYFIDEMMLCFCLN